MPLIYDIEYSKEGFYILVGNHGYSILCPEPLTNTINEKVFNVENTRRDGSNEGKYICHVVRTQTRSKENSCGQSDHRRSVA